MKPLLKYLAPYKQLLILGPTFKLLEAILELCLPYFMSRIIDYGVVIGDKTYVLKMGAWMLLTAIAGFCCAAICQYSASLVSQGVGTDIRNGMFCRINQLSSRELDQLTTTSLINRITNDVNQVQLAVAMLIRLVIRAPFLCIGGFVMSFLLDAKLSLILLVALPIFAGILSIIMIKTVPLYKKLQTSLDKITLTLRENMSGIRVVRAFARNTHEQERFAKSSDEYAQQAILVGKISALLNPITSLIMNFSIGAILWYGGFRVNSGNMSTGEVIAFISYVTQILLSLIIISNLVVIFTRAYTSAGRICQVLETCPSITDRTTTMDCGSPKRDVEESFKTTKNKEIPVLDSLLEFQNVSMSYQEGSNEALINVSFTIKKGETIGIIGGTGSGKSTLIQLIPRFYEVSEGCIRLCGRDIREYSLSDLRNRIGLVSQKAVLFTGTIGANIRWGKEDATIDEIKEAAKNAMAAEFIEEFIEGYDTVIKRGGVNLSGGQRQRLTIARALVRKPELLLLDDSFSALDFATDAKLRKELKKHRQQMTTILVSQRVSSIKTADQILVLHEGRLVGIGNHNELYQKCQVYQEICQSQEVSETAEFGGTYE